MNNQNAIKAYIIDDEFSNREIVSIMLQTYFPAIELIGEADNAETGILQLQNNAVDILFLDVLMPNKSGFDLLKEFSNRAFEVIFISGFDEHAIKAFAFSAIDYILKPIDKDQFIAAVNRAIVRKMEKDKLKLISEQNSPANSTKIQVIQNNKNHFIDLDSIAYLKGESGGYTEITCRDGQKFTISKSLKQLENELEGENHFIKVSKSITINVLDVAICDKGPTGYIVLHTDNLEIFLPRRKKKEVLHAIEQQLVQVKKNKAI